MGVAGKGRVSIGDKDGSWHLPKPKALIVRLPEGNPARFYLGVGQVESGIHLVQDVQRCRLEKQQGQNQREGHERPLAAAQLRQALLPHVPKGNANLEALEDTAALAHHGLQPRVAAGQQCGEDGPKVLVDLGWLLGL